MTVILPSKIWHNVEKGEGGESSETGSEDWHD